MAVVQGAVDAWGRSNLRRRYNALAPRERLLAQVCVALLAVLIFYGAVDALWDFRADAGSARGAPRPRPMASARALKRSNSNGCCAGLTRSNRATVWRSPGPSSI